MVNLRYLRSSTPGLSVGAAIGALALAIVLALGTIVSPSVQAQTYSVIHTFSGGGDGATPYAGLTMDGAGSLYGTTLFGGSTDYGVVYRLRRSGSNWVF